jgi:UDP-N-acetylglucosamine 2-epimerase (non-hydrolysing)
MIDTLIDNLDRARQRSAQKRFGVEEGRYVFVTLHRPANVDDQTVLTSIIGTLTDLSGRIDVIFPVHPRTRNRMQSFGIWEGATRAERLILTEPLNYLDTIGLVEKTRLVITDSGGLQEETSYLNVPCLTVRPNTERPITIILGTNQLTSPAGMAADIERILNGHSKQTRIPEIWDGMAAVRAVNEIVKFTEGTSA